MQLFFEKLGADQNNEFFKKINIFREQTALKMAQEILDREKKPLMPVFENQTSLPMMTTQTQSQDFSMPVMNQFPTYTQQNDGRSGLVNGPVTTNYYKPIKMSQDIEEETNFGDYVIKKKGFH